MPQKLALHLRTVGAEGVDVEVAPSAISAMRDWEGARTAVHAPLQALGHQQAQVALARLVGLPVLDDGPTRKHITLYGGRQQEACYVAAGLRQGLSGQR